MLDPDDGLPKFLSRYYGRGGIYPRQAPTPTVYERMMAEIKATPPGEAVCNRCRNTFVVSPTHIVLGREKGWAWPNVCSPCGEAGEQLKREAIARSQAQLAAERMADWHHDTFDPIYREATFGSWRTTGDDLDRVKGLVEQYAMESPMQEIIQPYRSILLVGPPGTGKTHLLAALGHVLIDRAGRVGLHRNPVAYVMGSRLTEAIKASYDRNYDGPSKDEIMQEYRNARLLILDDVADPGKETDSNHTRSIYFDLIDYRCSRGWPIAMASNATLRDTERFFGPPTFSRLAGMSGGFLVMNGMDKRRSPRK